MCQRGSEEVSRRQKCCAGQNEARGDGGKKKKKRGEENAKKTKQKNEPPEHKKRAARAHVAFSGRLSPLLRLRLPLLSHEINANPPPAPFFSLSLKVFKRLFAHFYVCVQVFVSM